MKYYIKKALLASAIGLAMPMTSFTTMPIMAAEVEVPSVETVEVESNDPFVRNYKITDGNESMFVSINNNTYEVYIDGELVPFEVEPIALPNATVNYSTGVNLTYNVPVKATVSLTAAAISLFCPGIGAYADIIARLVDLGSTNNIYLTCTQYRSVEQYYSSYAGVYYNKAINMNIRAYKNSIASSNLFYGPVNGSWFDPVRPY